MRIGNQLQFTEQHRFCVYRDFALSALDTKVLSVIYQPMVGGFAVSLYLSLYGLLSPDRIGFSPLDQQRMLFLSTDVEPGDRGRKYIIEQMSKLEAVGLLQTIRNYMIETEEYIYQYRLFQPLSPHEFFQNQHLVLLLRDKIGKYAVSSLQVDLVCDKPQELLEHEMTEEDVSVPFYDLFRLNTQSIDYDFERNLAETAATRDMTMKNRTERVDKTVNGFQYADIIMRFPKGSRNRRAVEQLQFHAGQMTEVNFLAKKYALTLPETCRLLDEDGVFGENGEFNAELFRQKANQIFRQNQKREDERESMWRRLADQQNDDQAEESAYRAEISVEEPFYLDVPKLFQGQCDIRQYNQMLRNEPYTRMLERFFTKDKVPDPVQDIFAKLDLVYKMNEEVVNVLIHFLHVYKGSSWSKSYIDAIASDMLGKGVHTYEQAVQFVRERMDRAAASLKPTGKSASASSAGKSRGRNAKPKIPIVGDMPSQPQLSDAELEQLRVKAQQRDRRIKG